MARAVAGRGHVVAPLGPEDLARCCSEIAAVNPFALGIAGGDGTVMQVLSALRRGYGPARMPPVFVLPFGTVNTTARRWGRLADPWQMLERVLSGVGRWRPRRTLRIDLAGTPYVAATVGLGLVSHFFDEYEQSGRRGTVRAAEIFTKVFLGSMLGHAYARRILAPVSGRLAIEGRASSLRAFSLLVCSVFEDVGLGLRPTYRASEIPGRIHLVATDLDVRRLGPQAIRVWLGRPLVADQLVDDLVNDFSLEFDRKTSIVLDGERLVAERIAVRAGDELLVWAPQ